MVIPHQERREWTALDEITLVMDYREIVFLPDAAGDKKPLPKVEGAALCCIVECLTPGPIHASQQQKNEPG